MQFGLRSVVICAAFIVTANCENLPSSIPRCKRNDKNISKCIKEAVEVAIPQLANGIEDIGIPKLEPLRIADVDLFGELEDPAFKLALRDIDVFGIPSVQVKRLKANLPGLTFRTELVIPFLWFTGKYELDNQAFAPLRGNGAFSANATNTVAKAVLRGDLKEAEGQKYIRLTDLDLKLKIGDYRLRLENLFGANSPLGQTANEIINRFRREYLVVATPLIQERVSEMLLTMGNEITKNLPYDEMFPEN